MKVFIIQSVELDGNDRDVWGYIYPNDRSLAVFDNFSKAMGYCKNTLSKDWDVNPEYLYSKVDPEDHTIRYIYESNNSERVVDEDILWAVIIERELWRF